MLKHLEAQSELVLELPGKIFCPVLHCWEARPVASFWLWLWPLVKAWLAPELKEEPEEPPATGSSPSWPASSPSLVLTGFLVVVEVVAVVEVVEGLRGPNAI